MSTMHRDEQEQLAENIMAGAASSYRYRTYSNLEFMAIFNACVESKSLCIIDESSKVEL